MKPALRNNLERLLHPRHIAVVGGNDAEVVIGECDRIGFDGTIWPVNLKRESIAGRRCYRSVDDLPEAPDAAFVAVGREAAIATIQQLAAMNAGGAVCYSAGFGEIGADGEPFERALVDAAGDLAIIGPNCYGAINFPGKVALWPFAHSGFCPGYGAAIVTQSGMLSSDLLMAQRSLPLAYMISAGNQSVIGIEDFVEYLIDDPAVRSIGLHIEGLRSITRFAAVAVRALDACKPLVVLKTGSSRVGASLTVSHTGSLSGTDELYQALFDQLGIIRVRSPSALIETLKFLSVAGAPDGVSLAGFTCSGGGATMLADHAERIGLDFHPPSPAATTTLKTLLPYTATVSNPLDYTTPVWGKSERLTPILNALLTDEPDAAVLVQDYPLPAIDESKGSYLADAGAFVASTRAAKVPAAICSTLPENIDQETREYLIKQGVAPMQGLHDCLEAIEASAWFSRRRKVIADAEPVLPGIGIVLSDGGTTEPRVLSERVAKERLTLNGICIPDAQIADHESLAQAADTLGFPLVLKWAGDVIAHKTEAGAVVVGIDSLPKLRRTAITMQKRINRSDENARFLVERMQPQPIVELLLGVRRDPQFGLTLTMGQGGTQSEIADDVSHVILPATRATIAQKLESLRLAPLLAGYRGATGVSINSLLDTIEAAIKTMTDDNSLLELEINPLFVNEHAHCAVDALILSH